MSLNQSQPSSSPRPTAARVEQDASSPAAPENRIGFPRIPPTTLAGRLALTYAVVVVVVVTVLGQYLSVTAREFYLSGLTSDLTDDAILISDIVERAQGMPAAADPRAADLDALAKSLGEQIGNRITVVARDGTVVGDSGAMPATMENHRDRPEIAAALGGEIGVTSRLSETLDAEFMFVAWLRSGADYVIRVGVPTTRIETAVAPIENGVRLGALIAAVIVAVVGVGVARRIAEPLDRLRQQANAVATGRLDERVEPAATYELGEVGRAFNLMTNQVRTSLSEAEAARARLESTLASLKDGVVVTDDRGVVVQMNASARRMLGVRSGVDGLPFVQISRDHELAGLLTSALNERATQSGTVEYARTRRILEATAQRISSPSERLAIIVLRDVTELRKLEGVRREFVANVSHELRTPLASIRALVETLETGAIEEPELAADFLRRIVNEVDRLAVLVDELLDLARLESGRVILRRERLRPAEVLSGALDRLRPQISRAGLTLDNEVPDELPDMDADRARVEQVMLNLVHNAIKFTPAGGTITVSARAEASAIVVTVSDTGVGVAPDEIPRLFERFYKADRARSSEGTGLGLAIAKHIVQVHGGSIWLESTPGAGSRFYFTLPRADAAEEPAPQAEARRQELSYRQP